MFLKGHQQIKVSKITLEFILGLVTMHLIPLSTLTNAACLCFMF